MGATPSQDDFPGTARFQVLEPLGAGAMCVVYKARDRQHGDVVALKTLKHLDSNSLYRLKQEFRALSHFDHPNLVSFYQLVNSEEGWFVTMELVEGGDFLTWVRGEEAGASSREKSQSTWATAQDMRESGSQQPQQEGSTPPEAPLEGGYLPDLIRLRSCLRQLAEGIATLHGVDRIHRDLKPDNVLVTNSGRVVILDFGLVAEIDQDFTEGTLHQSIAGSAAYMSPEQSVGMPLTESSDWYSVGVMLYEALTGLWPFSGHLYQILTAKNAEDPVPPKVLIPDCPDDLNDLCMALLERDPEARPSGPEVLARLRYQQVAVLPERPRLQLTFRYRDDEMALLKQALAVAQQGKPVVVFVSGPTGLGKTKLIREFVKEAKRTADIITLKSQCFEWEDVAFKALDGLMDNLTRVLRRADYDVLRSLGNEDLSWLAARFPVMARVDALDIAAADLNDLPPEEVNRRAFQGFSTVIRALAAHKPLLIHIDDANWGDPQSADFLSSLLGLHLDQPLLLVVGYRPGPTLPFVNWMAQSVRRMGLESATIELTPLSFDATRHIAGEMLGLSPGHPAVQELAQRSQGSPAAIRELVQQELVSAGANEQDNAELSEVMVRALETLPAPSVTILSLVCVAGGTLLTDLLVASANLGDATISAIATLRAHDLIRVKGAEQEITELTNARIADFVLDRISDANRRGYHAALASVMEMSGQYDASELVDHYAGAGDTRRAGTVAWMSATQAQKAGSWNDVIQLTERAIALGNWTAREQRTMSKQLGHSLAMMGRSKEAADVYRNAMAGAIAVEAEKLLLLATEQALKCGDTTVLPELGGLLERNDLPGFSGDLLAGGLGRLRRWRQTRRGTGFIRKLRVEVEPAALVKIDVAFNASGVFSWIDPVKARAMQPIHLETALDVGELVRALRALALEAFEVANRDPSDIWRAAIEEVVSGAQAQNSVAGHAWAESQSARAALSRGLFEETVQSATHAEVLFRRSGSGSAWELFLCRMTSLAARLELGQLRETANQAEPYLIESLGARNDFFVTELLTRILPWPRMAAGRAEATLQSMDDAMARWQGHGHRQHVLAARARAHLCAWLGTDHARAAFDRNWRDIKRYTDDPWIGPYLLQAQATTYLTSAVRGDSAATRTAESAAKQLTALGNGWSAWGTLLQAGCAGARGADPSSLLGQASSIAAKRGQPMLEAVADTLLGDAEAAARLIDEGVLDPLRFARALAPGASTA